MSSVASPHPMGEGGGGCEAKGLMTFQTITFHAHFLDGQEVQASHLLTKS